MNPKRTVNTFPHRLERISLVLALSALEPVVYDLFLVRVKTENKELEAQRMVIVQTLLKLVRYNKVDLQTILSLTIRLLLGSAIIDCDRR